MLMMMRTTLQRKPKKLEISFPWENSPSALFGINLAKLSRLPLVPLFPLSNPIVMIFDYVKTDKIETKFDGPILGNTRHCPGRSPCGK